MGKKLKIVLSALALCLLFTHKIYASESQPARTTPIYQTFHTTKTNHLRQVVTVFILTRMIPIK